MDAIEAIWRHQGDSRQYFALSEIPVDDVIRPKWRDIVIEDALGGGKRVNRINYEICVLQTLRDKLRCKEVWVVGANRYRNPDDALRYVRAPRPPAVRPQPPRSDISSVTGPLLVNPSEP